jgi:hypothetical protein
MDQALKIIARAEEVRVQMWDGTYSAVSCLFCPVTRMCYHGMSNKVRNVSSYVQSNTSFIKSPTIRRFVLWLTDIVIQ